MKVTVINLEPGIKVDIYLKGGKILYSGRADNGGIFRKEVDDKYTMNDLMLIYQGNSKMKSGVIK